MQKNHTERITVMFKVNVIQMILFALFTLFMRRRNLPRSILISTWVTAVTIKIDLRFNYIMIFIVAVYQPQL